VATDTGGVAEVVVDGETGILVPPGRPAAAAEAIAALARDASVRRRMALSSRSRLGDEFDIRVMVRDLERLYSEILDECGTEPTAATTSSHLGGGYPQALDCGHAGSDRT
jgi:glycosyltransferase involved in cell wall biosynthesis